MIFLIFSYDNASLLTSNITSHFISRKSILFCHKQVIGMKKIFIFSFYSDDMDQKPLLGRKLFPVRENVSQRQDEDLIPGSFLSEQGFNLQNGEHHNSISPYPVTVLHITIYTLLVKVRPGPLSLSSVASFVFYL